MDSTKFETCANMAVIGSVQTIMSVLLTFKEIQLFEMHKIGNLCKYDCHLSYETVNERHVNFLKRYNRMDIIKYETCANMTVIGSVQTVNERHVNFFKEIQPHGYHKI